MKQNYGWIPDSEVKTKVITYEQVNTGAHGSQYFVQVYDGSKFLFSKDWLSVDEYFDWFSGAPALYMFDVEPESGKKYYVNVELEVLGKYCTWKGRYKDGSSEATLSFNPLTNVDTDEDGKTNGYDDKTPDITPPDKPTGLSVTPVSANQINLAWSATHDNVAVTGYEIYRSKSYSASTFLTRVTSPSYSNRGLDAGTLYCYMIKAYDAANRKSEYSQEVCDYTTTPDTTPPSIPAGLSD